MSFCDTYSVTGRLDSRHVETCYSPNIPPGSGCSQSSPCTQCSVETGSRRRINVEFSHRPKAMDVIMSAALVTESMPSIEGVAQVDREKLVKDALDLINIDSP